MKWYVVLISALLITVGLSGCAKDESVELSYLKSYTEKERAGLDGKEISINGFLNLNTTPGTKYGLLSASPAQTDVGASTEDGWADTTLFLSKENIEWGSSPITVSGIFRNKSITDNQGFVFDYYIEDASIREYEVSEEDSDELKTYYCLVESNVLNEFDSIMTYNKQNMNTEFNEIEYYRISEDSLSNLKKLLIEFNVSEDVYDDWDSLSKEIVMSEQDYMSACSSKDVVTINKILGDTVNVYRSVYIKYVLSVVL